MRLNSKVTWGLAWAGLAVVLAVPSADFLTGGFGKGDNAAVLTSDIEPVKPAETASVTTTKTPNGVSFDLTYNGATASVAHSGSEPALFENTDIPVVAEGRWKGDVFQSERLVIKHDENYDEENPDRIDAARDAGR